MVTICTVSPPLILINRTTCVQITCCRNPHCDNVTESWSHSACLPLSRLLSLLFLQCGACVRVSALLFLECLSALLNRFKAGVYCCAAPPCYRCIPPILLPSAPASQMVSLQELIQPSHMCAAQTLAIAQTHSRQRTQLRIYWAAHILCLQLLCYT